MMQKCGGVLEKCRTAQLGGTLLSLSLASASRPGSHVRHQSAALKQQIASCLALSDVDALLV